MASTWIAKRPTAAGGTRFRVMFRVGGRASAPRYAGSFGTQREALARRAWVAGELAAMRVPDLELLAEPTSAPTLREMAARWRGSRVDVTETTKVLHRVSLDRVLPELGDKPVDEISTADVARLVELLDGKGKARETIRKSITALAMVLDFAGVAPNPARDRVRVRLPREDPGEMEPPTAEHVEAVCWRLHVAYVLPTLILDATGVRVGELEHARVGDLDEERRAWLVRGAVSKTRKPRWVELPDDLYDAVVALLPPREDRDATAPLVAGFQADRLRTAIARACRDGGVPAFSPHALRHRRISLMHRNGVSWADIGARMGQRSRVVTADTYSHAIIDGREVDRAKLLARAGVVQTPVQTLEEELAGFAG